MTELSGLIGAFAGIFLFVILIVIAIYVVEGIFLFKLNKAMYGKGTPMAFIPFANTYLLGKLTVNKTIGWILVIGSIVTSDVSITLNGQKTSFSLLPAPLSSIVSGIISLATLGLFIYAIVKYFNIKNGKISPNEDNANQNTNQTENVQNSNFTDINQNNLNTINEPVDETNMGIVAEDNVISAPVLDQESNVQAVEQPQSVDNVNENGVDQNVLSFENTVEHAIQQPIQNIEENNMGKQSAPDVQTDNIVEQPVETPQVNVAQQNQTLNAFSMKPTNQEVSSESEIKSTETVEATNNNSINQ